VTDGCAWDSSTGFSVSVSSLFSLSSSSSSFSALCLDWNLFFFRFAFLVCDEMGVVVAFVVVVVAGVSLPFSPPCTGVSGFFTC